MRKTATTVITAALGLVAVAAPAGSQTLLDKILAKAMRPKSVAAAPAGSPTGANGGTFVAAITPAQQAEINRLLAAPLQDQRIAADRAAATPLIVKLLGIGACARESDAWNAINRDRLTPQTFKGYLPWLTPNGNTTYHDKSRCLDVQRLGDWSKPANNALRFRVWYVAEDSGEAGNQRFELQKGSDGIWLVRDVSWGAF